ncbi:hypothetical protein Rhe02_60170 [Rhizocola hellebori]|uniref:Uncharacterized protein n=1 Tax=Rhizocola hellebori TaxID=1392758 RepID=A0A8J3QC69_9ACTN|nr:hypothetical protein [Rhizocola hellebori]GIH07950.1 hypothetical protein Rhe02_60170 [Rhizocola hellebori]
MDGRNPVAVLPGVWDGPAMAFFSSIAFHGDSEPQPEPARPAWMKPEDVLPSLVPVEQVLVRTEAVAIALSGLWCYPSGFAFGLQIVLREPDRRGRLMSNLHHMAEPGEPIPPEMLRLGLQFADGGKVTNLPGRAHPWHAEPVGPIMLAEGGGGGNRGYSLQHWVWPLPPPGPLTFVCEWPHFQIGQTETSIDAEVVIDAAARAVVLWPDR